MFADNVEVASKAVLELARLSDKLRKSSSFAKLHMLILDRMGLAVARTLAGEAKLTQDDLQHAYQLLGTILGQKTIPHEIRVSTMKKLIEVQEVFLADRKYGPVVAESATKALINLLRGFEQEVPGDLKPILGKLAASAIRGVENYPQLWDTFVLLFNKLVAAAGPGLLPLLTQFMEVTVLHAKSCESLSAIVKLITLTVATWKNPGIAIAVQAFGFIFSSVAALGFPADKISDINKSTLEIAYSFTKLIKILCVISPITLVSFPLEQFRELMLYLSKWTSCALEGSLKRAAVELFVTLIAAALDLKSTLDGTNKIILEFIKDETKENIKSSIMLNPEYRAQVQTLLETAKVVATESFEALSPYNALDLLSLHDIAALQFLLCKIAGPDFVELLKTSVGKTSPAGLESALEEVEKSGTVRNYREVLRKILIAKKSE